MTDTAPMTASSSNSFRSNQKHNKASLCSFLLFLTIVFIAGTLVACGTIFSPLPVSIASQRHLLSLLIIICTAISLELFVQRSYKVEFDFAKPSAISRPALARICQQFVGLLICIVCLIPSVLFQPFKEVTTQLIAIILLFGGLSPFYFLLIECYGKNADRDDELLILSRFALNPLKSIKDLKAKNVEPRKITALLNLSRNIILKGYFVPQLLASSLHFWASWEHYAVGLVSNLQHGQINIITQDTFIALVGLIHVCLIHLASAAGTSMPFAGYLLSLRILGNHIRSTDSTFGGWLFMMLAYLPVCNLPGMFLSRTSILWPASLWHFNQNLILFLTSAFVSFVLINTWSDLTLGLKFSNVSYRGVVRHGPYSLVRHPAYTAKLAAWALALVPSMLTLPGFIQGAFGWFALAAIYVMRALTEERHLSQFAEYRDYCAHVKKRFIPYII